MPELSKKKYRGKVNNLDCPECEGTLVLRDSKYGPFYGCCNFPQCKAAHGAYPDGSPLGIPADKETKRWREKCHEVFDRLWKDHSYGYSRKQAYRVLQVVTDLPKEDAHISKFDIKTCKYVIKEIKRLYL